MQKKVWLFLLGVTLLGLLLLSVSIAFNSTVVASPDHSSRSISPAAHGVESTRTPGDERYEGYLKGEWAGQQAGVRDCKAKTYNPPTSKVFDVPNQSEYDSGYAYGEHRGYEAGYKSCYQ